MSTNLEDLRRKIDALDDKIHDVLMERASLIASVAEEKRKKNLPFVQPAREATMIRRLLGRHEGPLPARAVVNIWRELVGAVSLMQTGLKVSVSIDKGNVTPWEMAKDYFGSVVPMIKAPTPLVAISSVRDNESSFAVVPWPREGEEKPWWPYLFSQQDTEKMRIVCALPYGTIDGEILSNDDRALVVSKVDYMPSGADHSFLALEVDHSVSRTRIVDMLKNLNLEPLSLRTKSSKVKSLHFIEVNNFIACDIPVLTQIVENLEGLDARCVSLGGYPVPPVYKKQKASPVKLAERKKA
jgi:chorismate mutase/prephenate dehydratase